MEEKQPRSFVTREAGALPAYLMGRHGRPRVVDNARRARTGVANRFEGNLRLDISGDEDEVEKANAAARGDPEPATHFAKDKEPAANDEVKKSKNRRRRKKKKAAGGPSTRWWISRAVALCAAVPLLYLVYAVVSGFPSSTEAAKLL